MLCVFTKILIKNAVIEYWRSVKLSWANQKFNEWLSNFTLFFILSIKHIFARGKRKSFRQILRDVCLLHTRKVKVGNINHSVGTISKMKKHLASAVQDFVKEKLKTPQGNSGPCKRLLIKWLTSTKYLKWKFVLPPC